MADVNEKSAGIESLCQNTKKDKKYNILWLIGLTHHNIYDILVYEKYKRGTKK